ncbi:hypothetical protein EAI_15974 [Harpegnathos saltator]|uniref:Uncharacterized protein n=1 Tax=Harpegnathos saltator TaxID=610380 RepID=E2C4Q1_HARSA|nr:hypothetical protein EAI_15974 [Harpegnathos saltator]
MMRKVTKDEPNRRPNRPRRRRFESNQFSSVPNVEVDEEVNEETSASAKKLKASAEDVIVNPIMNDLELQIGPECKKCADTYDKNRVKRQDQRSQDASKEARTAQKEENAAQLDVFIEEEGLLYGPGIAD